MMQKGVWQVLSCYVLWGLLPIFWKLMGALDSFYVLASRVVWSLLFTIVVLAVRRNFSGVRAVLRSRRELGLLTLACILICINWGLYIWAVSNGHMIDSSLAYYMCPIFTVLLGALVFRERLNLLQWLAVATAAAGLAVTACRYRKFPWLALAIGATFSVYCAVKKGVRSDAATASFFETLLPLPLFLGFILRMEAHGAGALGALRGWQWILLPLCGVVTTTPLLLYASGIKRISLTLAGILMYLNPSLQLLISVWLYGEEFTSTHAILFGFVWGSIALYLLSGLQEERSQKKAAVR